ncbi:MAG: VOC family protein [Acidobacteriota bacterium]
MARGEHFSYGGPAGTVQGVQMHLGGAWIVLASARPRRSSPIEASLETQSLTVFVDDVDTHFERTKASGAQIVEEERQYGVEDLESHSWFSRNMFANVRPEEWGAIIS